MISKGKLFDRNQLSARRVGLVLEKMGVNADAFAAEYEALVIPRTRKNRLSTLSEKQVAAIRALVSDRTPEREIHTMGILGIKTRTTLDRIIADFAVSLV